MKKGGDIFYFLVSNTEDNAAVNDIQVNLPAPISLTGGDWEVGLLQSHTLNQYSILIMMKQ